ncbi:MAG: YdcF family protein [Bacteroidetes bacterium]|nr:MAG: YdcF family protein [Bacteroidota bacterium]
MFFVLSKLSLFFLKPINWLLCLGICYWLVRHAGKRKRIAIAAGIIFFVFSNGYLYRTCLMAWQPAVVIQKPAAIYRCGIVLSGMTVMNEKGQTFFSGTSDRFIQICRLYHTKAISTIIVSGGDGSLAQSRPKEADFLRAELMAQGIPPQAIVVENQSRNTHESAVAVKKLLDSLQITAPSLLVTSAMHMRRSLQTFAKAQMAVVPLVANYEVIENTLTVQNLLMPNLLVLRNWQYLIKEMVGLAAYKLTNKA